MKQSVVGNNGSLSKEEFEAASNQDYDEKSWKPLIDFFWNRYNKRYFLPIKALQDHTDFEIRNNCGFLVASIDCILIETLEQYYTGQDESLGKLHDPFYSFFKRSKAFKGAIENDQDAGKFAGLVRSGLLHQSKTKKASVINKKNSTPIIGWIDPSDKNKGFEINRDLFHSNVHEEYKNLIKNLKSSNNVDLREKFKSKIQTIIE